MMPSPLKPDSPLGRMGPESEEGSSSLGNPALLPSALHQRSPTPLHVALSQVSLRNTQVVYTTNERLSALGLPLQELPTFSPALPSTLQGNNSERVCDWARK